MHLESLNKTLNSTLISFSFFLFFSNIVHGQSAVDDQWEIEKIAGGFAFTEGPVWKSDKLFFSDLGDNKIYTWSDEKGIEKFLDPSGNTIGINEGDRELDFSGIFRIGQDGTLYLLDKTVEQPNGITFSRDETTLYVSDSRYKEVYAWDVEDTVNTSKRLFATFGGNGYIDGMTTDDEGRLYVACPFGVCVFEEDGSIADTIPIGKQCSNCNWGAEVGGDLFVTSGTELYKVRERTSGYGSGGVLNLKVRNSRIFFIPIPIHFIPVPGFRFIFLKAHEPL